MKNLVAFASAIWLPAVLGAGGWTLAYHAGVPVILVFSVTAIMFVIGVLALNLYRALAETERDLGKHNRR